MTALRYDVLFTACVGFGQGIPRGQTWSQAVTPSAWLLPFLLDSNIVYSKNMLAIRSKNDPCLSTLPMRLSK